MNFDEISTQTSQISQDTIELVKQVSQAVKKLQEKKDLYLKIPLQEKQTPSSNEISSEKNHEEIILILFSAKASLEKFCQMDWIDDPYFVSKERLLMAVQLNEST